MLDIDFLQMRLADINTDQPLIYVYRTGALRTKVFRRLRKVTSQKTEMSSYRLDEINSLTPDALLPTYRYCDWPTSSKLSTGTLDRVASVLASPGCSSLALFLPFNAPLLQHHLWGQIKRTSIVFEEASITERTLQPYLRYLDSKTDLAAPGTFLRQATFALYFSDVRRGESIDLTELIRRFDEIVLVRSDLRTNEVAPPDEEFWQADERGPAFLRTLRALVEDNDDMSLIPLVRHAKRRREQGRSCIDRQRELYIKSADLLIPSQKGRSRKDFHHREHMAVLWSATLLAWDNKLSTTSANGRRTPEIFTLVVDQLAREFVSRSSRSEDPLYGLWPSLIHCLESTCADIDQGLPGARRRLVLALNSCLLRDRPSERPEWITRFSGLVQQAVQAINKVDSEVN